MHNQKLKHENQKPPNTRPPRPFVCPS